MENINGLIIFNSSDCMDVNCFYIDDDILDIYINHQVIFNSNKRVH